VPVERKVDEMLGGFKKEKTVFRTYQEDNEDTTELMLAQDLRYSKIMRDCRTELEREDLKKVIEKFYSKLKNIFLFYVSKSVSYPAMDMNDLDTFCKQSKIYDRNLNKATLDRTVTQTTLPNTERLIYRHDFIELMIRLGLAKYREQKPTITITEAAELVFTREVVGRNEKNTIEARLWRENYLYTAKVHEILRRNEKETKKLFEANLGARQKYLHFDDVVRIIKKANLNLSDERISRCFIECLMPKVDSLKDLKAARQMKYVEFIVMIGRIAHELYSKTKQ